MPRGIWRPRRLAWLELASVLAVLATLTLLFTRPPVADLRRVLPADLGDPLLNVYLMEWAADRLQHGLRGFWDAGFFHPTSGVIALSDHMIGAGFVLLVLERLAPVVDGLLAYNVLFLSSFVLGGLVVYAVARAEDMNRWGAGCAAAVFAFNPYRWSHVSHLQILLGVLVPAVLWTFSRLVRRPTWRRGGAFLSLYVLHLLGGVYLAYMVHFAFAVILLLEHRRVLDLLRRRDRTSLLLLGLAAVTVLLAVVLFLPYVMRAEALGLERSPHEIRFYGASFLSLLTVSPVHDPWAVDFLPYPQRPENALFPGWTATVLLLAGLWSRRSGRDGSVEDRPTPSTGPRLAGCACILSGLLLGELITWRLLPDTGLDEVGLVARYGFCLALVLVGLGLLWRSLPARARECPVRARAMPGFSGHVLAVGLLLALLALPTFYLPLSQVVPGMGAMRVPTRLWSIVSFAIAWFAGLAADRAARALPRVRMTMTFSVLALLLVAENHGVLDWAVVPRATSQAYQVIASSSEVRVIAEFPHTGDARETIYMYTSLMHGKPLVNGYSSRTPASSALLFPPMSLPDLQAMTSLREVGVTHVVVHWDRLRRSGWRRNQLRRWHRGARGIGLEHVLSDGGVRLYRVGVPGDGGPSGVLRPHEAADEPLSSPESRRPTVNAMGSSGSSRGEAILLHLDLQQSLAICIDALPWTGSPSSGVERRRLEREAAEHGRATSVVRYLPGASFPTHVHGGGEELLVLDGTFSDQSGDFPAGTYVRNPVGSSHAPHSAAGCVLFVKLCQMHREEQTQTVRSLPWFAGATGPAASEVILYRDRHETVRCVRVVAGGRLELAGAEALVLEGALRSETGEGPSSVSGYLPALSWLRVAAADRWSLAATEDTVLWIKEGHLPPAGDGKA